MTSALLRSGDVGNGIWWGSVRGAEKWESEGRDGEECTGERVKVGVGSGEVHKIDG